MEQQDFFVTAALGLEDLLLAELGGLGIGNSRRERAGVAFQGSLGDAYRVCLWSRLASRVLLPLCSFPATDADQLYAETLNLDWSEHLSCAQTFAVDCTTSRSNISHSKYAALRVKDALVDQFRARTGERPSVATENPDLRINLHILRDQATLSIDLSGDSLHRRGYRSDGVHAPLKENLAAAILLRAGWPEICAVGGALVDPLCGSGSLPLEAALLATGTAPGLLRTRYGFLNWLQHDRDLWQEFLAEATERSQNGKQRKIPPLIGYDADQRAIRAAWQHAQNAGLDKLVHFERRTLREFTLPREFPTGPAGGQSPLRGTPRQRSGTAATV